MQLPSSAPGMYSGAGPYGVSTPNGTFEVLHHQHPMAHGLPAGMGGSQVNTVFDWMGQSNLLYVWMHWRTAAGFLSASCRSAHCLLSGNCLLLVAESPMSVLHAVTVPTGLGITFLSVLQMGGVQPLPQLGHHLRQGGGPGYGAEVAAAAAGEAAPPTAKGHDPGTPPTGAAAGTAPSGSSEDNSEGRPLKKRQRGGQNAA